ncbi:Serine proteases, trypsin family, serine active site,Peptidase S1, PA clan,Serine proteases, trypsin [Cinara cedri]|uniref:Serine proteases, trypsin family, serine active site,Peptidase S1, PA clan,Serine proteases, trypsin n=1 Tax=Cinara cedri TaxID=506608 RepID=A0A5E4NAZ8_9HEMI|nr:Hypothetical protein CINCED_3A009858 [Cinara cedri]VVC38767.1 Serine proteases, trypsin family, serine active site,Peptidase S1, PA clan,Serine proteases, trypsin [Cinara cedri]
MRDNSMSPRRNRLCRCVLVFFPTLVLLLSGRCAASDDKNNGTTTTTTTTTSTSTTAGSASELTLSWTTAEYPTTLMPSPLSGNDTVASVAAGKPSKFDEHVEDWQYVDDPLKNVTAPVVGAAGNSSGPAAFVCKMCAMQMLKNKSPRNKRNHDNRLYGKMPNNKSSRHRDLYAELMAVAASKQSYRRKRFRRSAAAAATSLADAAADSSSTYRRYKRFRRSAYPNGMIRPYRYHGNQQQQYPSLLAADLQQQHNRRRRYRYAADPYHQKRNAGATPWDRSAEFRRRYLRFPPTHDGPPPAYTNNNPWSPSVAPVPPGHPPPPPPPPPQSAIVQQPFSYLPQYPVQQQPPPPPPPAMGPRSPRLVFRDPVDQGTLQAPYGGVGGPNGLQDLLVSQPDDVKDESWADLDVDGKRNSLCGTGSCEFLLTCWMASGYIESTCGGFLYVCCDRNSAKTNENIAINTNRASVPIDYGPVTNDPSCGVSVAKQQGAQRRIVGGDEAGFGSFPWQAYIRIGSSRCGGSLVNRYHVVTAGHCVARASARQVQVTLGDYVINSAVEPLPAYTFGVRKISVHPFFKFTPQADRFDVAVLRLDRPVQYMPHIAPICLPDKGEDFLGHYGWAAGWGALQAGSRLRPKTLQAVDVPIIDNRQCERWHKSNGINVIIYDEMMCAGYREGSKDSCQGDSGGPLMLEKTGRWYLIGIVSAGYSCAQRGQPGIYHRVPLTVDWISYIINSAQQ